MMLLIFKSILAGTSISIASAIYLKIGGVIGAILFSVGLLIILNMEFKLFTGTIGYLNSLSDLKDNSIILIGNLIGCFAALPSIEAQNLITQKLSLPLHLVFDKAVICGALIYIAVFCFKNKKVYMVPVCVTAFILYGAEHCIADFCFMVAASIYSIKFLIVVILGNAIGAILLNKIIEGGSNGKRETRIFRSFM